MRHFLVNLAFAALVSTAGALAGCDTPLPLAPKDSAAAPSTAVTAGAVSYKTDVAPLLVARCAGCHASGEEGARDLVLFDASGGVSYAAAKGKIASIVKEVSSGKMPQKRTPLTADEMAILRSWQSAKTPNN